MATQEFVVPKSIPITGPFINFSAFFIYVSPFIASYTAKPTSMRIAVLCYISINSVMSRAFWQSF
jgi:hypothetical protein